MEKLSALLTLHVITGPAAAVVNADIFVACGRLIVYQILIDQAVARETVKTSVNGSGTYINALCPEMLFNILGSQMLTAVVLHELKDLSGLLGVICAFGITCL